MRDGVRDILLVEQERIATALLTETPGTPGYGLLLGQLSILTETIHSACSTSLRGSGYGQTMTAGEGTRDCGETQQYPASQGSDGEKAEGADGTAPDTDWAQYRMALRERLSNARLSGINTTQLIHAVGAAKLSSVPDETLPQLSDLLEKALEEKG